jgi:hypothetical protein
VLEEAKKVETKSSVTKKPREEDKEGDIKPTATKKQPLVSNELTKDMSKPPSGYPGLAGDLS